MIRQLDEQQIAVIRELGRQFSDATIQMHEAIAKKAGLTGTDHKYLGILMEHGAMTAGELSRFTGLTSGAVTGVIDRFEKKKLVERMFDKDDRRKVLIVPKYENAMALLGDVFQELQSKIVALISGLTETEAQIIEKYLRSTIDVMKDVTQSLQESTNNKP